MSNFLLNAWPVLPALAVSVGWILSNWQKTLQIRELREKLKTFEESRAKADSRVYAPTSEEIAKILESHVKRSSYRFYVSLIGVILGGIVLIGTVSRAGSAYINLKLAEAQRPIAEHESARLEMRFGSNESVVNGDVMLRLSSWTKIDQTSKSQAIFAILSKTKTIQTVTLLDDVGVAEGVFYDDGYSYAYSLTVLDKERILVQIERRSLRIVQR